VGRKPSQNQSRAEVVRTGEALPSSDNRSRALMLPRTLPRPDAKGILDEKKVNTKTIGADGFLGKRRQEGPGIVFVFTFAPRN
jgi:hypothetical protein